MAYVREITYQMYTANGREQGIHTAEAPAISQEEWDQTYPGGVWIPSTEQTPGAVEKPDAECEALCEASEANMERLIAE